MKAGCALFVAVALTGLLSLEVSADSISTTLNANDLKLSEGWSTIFVNAQQALSRAVDANNGSKAVILVEYAVLPPVQRRFVEIYKKLISETEKESGVKVFGLSRTIDENLTFYLYSEWDSLKAWGEHFVTDYSKKFLEEIFKIGVVYKIHTLDQIAVIKPGHTAQ